MPSKTLTAVWAGIDFALLLAGVMSIALSIIWQAPDLLHDLVITTTDRNAGLGLSIVFDITFTLSVAAILTPKYTTTGLKALNWVLVADSVATIVIGSLVWFYTLDERENFNRAVATGACGSSTFAITALGCVGSVTDYADYTLSDIFSSVYGFQAIIIAFFLTATCIINKRVEEERFCKIDAKCGRRGFV